jgi:hypothetical protein
MMFRNMQRVRLRMKMQAALNLGTRASIVAAGVVLVGIYLLKLGLLHRAWPLAAVAGGLVLAGAALGALRKVRYERVATQIDLTHGLHDRVTSAWAFTAEKQPTPFMLAAKEDAERQTIDPKRAAPLKRPEGLGLTGVTLAVAAGVALLYFPGVGPVRQNAAPRLPRLSVADEALRPQKEAAEELQRAADETDDPELKEATNELNKLMEQLQNEELTRKQAFDKLAEIEKKIRPGSDGDFEELKRMLKKAGAELSKEKLTREAGQALEKEDLKKAKEELEKLAAEAEKLDQDKKKDPKTEKQREELARSLERAAKEQKQENEQQKREQQLKEEERRLKKELAQKPNDQELQRKLQRNQRELQRLEREKQQRAEQQRQLQRLQRELQKAAEQLRQKLSPQAAEALRQAAQQLGQMENEIKKLGTGQRAQLQIAEIKEVLRRVGRSGQSQQGSNGSPGGQGQEQQAQNGANGQNGKNGKGKDGKGGELLREFNSRAGGKPNALLLGGQGGDQRILLPLGGGGPQGDKPGQGGQGQQLPGDGIGSEHDPNVLGNKTKIDSQRKDTRVEGQEGAGPSRSETILGSAEKGFSSRAYKRVYGDYSSVVEEVMSKEKVPPGYRFYVKRYFQLIKPRE